MILGGKTKKMTIDEDISKIKSDLSSLRHRGPTDRSGLYVMVFVGMLGAVSSCTKLSEVKTNYEAILQNQQKIMQKLDSSYPVQPKATPTVESPEYH